MNKYIAPFEWSRSGDPRKVVCTFESEGRIQGKKKIELYDKKSPQEVDRWIEVTSKMIADFLLLNCPDQKSVYQWTRMPPTQEVVNQCVEKLVQEVITFFRVNTEFLIPLITFYIDGIKVYLLHLFAKLSMWPTTDDVKRQCTVALAACAEKNKRKMCIESMAPRMNPFQFPLFRICFPGHKEYIVTYGINTKKLDTPAPKTSERRPIPFMMNMTTLNRVMVHLRRDPKLKMQRKYTPIRMKLK